MEEKRKQVLSCIQPTGDLHLGNYFGAVENWVNLQNEYDCVYGVVDYHSMTMPYKAKNLRENTWKMAFQLLASGIKVENLFIQSLIPEHIELSWILGCVCSYGEMTRMTQFKDKSDQVKTKDKDAFISGGLFYYPVLQAADILIYHADYVPIGKDQEQHLELSRNIAARFNNQFKEGYFTHPEPLYTQVPKLLSLANPEKKMSKSLGEKHYVNLFGDEARIAKQVRSAVTDTGQTQGGEMSRGVHNLFELLRACKNLDAHQSLMDDYNAGSLKYSDLKQEVADTLVNFVRPFKANLDEIHSNKKMIKSQVKDASSDIRKKAQETLKEVRALAGLMNLK